MSTKVAGINSHGEVDPQKVVSKKVYAAALKAVNEIRTACGKKALKKLPFGDVGQPSSCPLYNALEDVGVESVSGRDISGNLKLKGGMVYDLDNEEFIDLDITPNVVMVKTPLGEVEVEVQKAEFQDGVDEPDMIYALREAADEFVNDFDAKGEKFLEKRGY